MSPEEQWFVFAFKKSGYSLRDQFSPNEALKLLEKLAETTPLFEKSLAQLDKNKLNQLIRSEEMVDFKTLHRIMINPPGQSPVIGEKSLDSVFFARELLEIYPNAFFIFIVRDPRAVVLSKAIKHIAKKEGGKTVGLEASYIKPTRHWISYFVMQSFRWKFWVNTCLDLTRDPSLIDRCLLIKFEDLLKGPEVTTRKILKKIDVPFEEGVLDVERRKSDPILVAPTSYAHQNLGMPIDVSRINSFDNGMHPYLTWTIEHFLKRQLRDLDYKRKKRHLGLFERLRLVSFILIESRRIIQLTWSYRKNRRTVF